MELKVIIIDDEPDAIEALENIILNHTSNVKVVAKTNYPTQSIELITKYKPDFVFLDIEMPAMNGFELLDCIPKIDFEVVFVTAFSQYAINAIKKNALDYILKPIRISEVVQTIEKVRARRKENKLPNESYKKLALEMKDSSNQPIKLPTLSGIDFVSPKEIIRLEASGSYTKLLLLNGEQLLLSKSIKESEKYLSCDVFFRSHRSHIVNLMHIKRFETNKGGCIVMVDGGRIPLSRRKKDEFIDVIGMELDEHIHNQKDID